MPTLDWDPVIVLGALLVATVAVLWSVLTDRASCDRCGRRVARRPYCPWCGGLVPPREVW